MDAWVIGLIAVVVLGAGLILYGALSDRVKHRRRVAELTSAPARRIPSLSGTAPKPAYLSELQARRPPADGTAPALDAGARDALRHQLETEDVLKIDIGYASKDFVTDSASGWAVLDEPRILACAEPVTAIRELIGLLERAALSDTALVVVAPGIDAQVLETLEVNRIQQKLRILVVLSRDPKPVDAICAATRATLVGRADLQAGYVTGSELGVCSRWISSARASHLLGAPGSRPERTQA